MSKNKKYMLASLGLLLLLGVFVFDRPEVAAQAVKPPQQVQVVNRPASPALVQDAPMEPVSTASFVPVAAAETLGSVVAYIVAPGKRLVIEFASADAVLNGGDEAYFIITTNDSLGNPKLNYFTGTKLPFVGTNPHVIASQQMRLYADPGNVTVSMFRAPTGGNPVHAFFQLNGYLVDK